MKPWLVIVRKVSEWTPPAGVSVVVGVVLQTGAVHVNMSSCCTGASAEIKSGCSLATLPKALDIMARTVLSDRDKRHAERDQADEHPVLDEAFRDLLATIQEKGG